MRKQQAELSYKDSMMNMSNLTPPTANLTEREAVDRAEMIRQRQHMVYGAGNGAQCQPLARDMVEFRPDWQRMFYREGQGSLD